MTNTSHPAIRFSDLIDYKSAKNPQLPSGDSVDLQLGLYAIAIEQRYGQVLHQMSLLYLRTGQTVTFEATSEHRQRVTETIGKLALKLRDEEDWQPQCGAACDTCTYAKYCPAVNEQPEALPQRTKKGRSLQLSLGV